MNKYERPVVMINEELAEGVYAASGFNNGDCYTVRYTIVQEPEVGQDCYVVQFDADHSPEDQHHSTGQLMQIVFNVPVTYVASNGVLVSGDGTNTLLVKFDYHNNSYETGIGYGNLYVKGTGVAVESAKLMCNYTCEAHDSLGNY